MPPAGWWQIARHEMKKQSPLLESPGFSELHICPDWMHTVDLGIGQQLIAAVLWECMEAGVWEGNNRQQKIEAIMAEIKLFHRQLKVKSPLQDLTSNMIRSSRTASPSLKCKAAECRGLQPMLVS